MHEVFPLAGKKVWVAGHRGMVGAALVRRLSGEACDVITAGREQADLTRQSEVEQLVAEMRPDAIILAAAKVGGILANTTLPADFIYANTMIAANIVDAAHRSGVPRLLYIGSSAVYPNLAPQPIREDALLTGAFDPSHEGYAVAKIAGIKLAKAYRLQHGRDYISALPTNLYGPGDNFDLNSSHVVPALIRKAHDAKVSGQESLTIWGTGTPRREFLHSDDCADALVFLLRTYSGDEPVNVGSGDDLPIIELARMIAEVVGFKGEILTDPSKPDGTPRKLMSAEKLAGMGWQPKIPLREGIASVYRWYLEHQVA